MMSVKELAEFLKISESTIRRLVRKKEIPFFRMGSRILFSKEDIELYIKNQYYNIEEKIYV